MKFTIVFLIAFFIIPIILFGQCNKKVVPPAIYPLRQADNNIQKENKQVLVDTIFKSKELAIKYAELILFDIYGKSQILKETPYKSDLIDGVWKIRGALHAEHGGVFVISFNSTDGQVIELGHGK